MRGSDSISIEEMVRVVEVAVGPLAIRDRTLIELLAATGLRVSEIAALELHQLFDGGRARDTLHLAPGNTKRRRGGKLPLNARIQAMLELYRVWLDGWYEGQWLFPGYSGKHISARAVQKVIKRLRRDAGLTKKVTPHSLRKYFINRLLDAGVDIRTVKTLSRHASFESLHAYTEENEEDARRAVEGLANVR